MLTVTDDDDEWRGPMYQWACVRHELKSRADGLRQNTTPMASRFNVYSTSLVWRRQCGLSWTVSVPVNGTAGPVERHGTIYRHWSVPLWWNPNDVPIVESCPLTKLNSVVCSSFTLLLLLLLLLPGWQTIMGLNRIRKKKRGVIW